MDLLNSKNQRHNSLPDSGDFCGDSAEYIEGQKGAKFTSISPQIGEITQITKEFFGNLEHQEEAPKKSNTPQPKVQENAYSTEELSMAVDVFKLLINVRNRCRENGHIDW